jgi:hypothetical protein
MVNWTQTPHLSAIWDHLLHRFLPENPPRVSGDEKPYLFVDLADPQKRSPADIRRMLGQLGDFERFYRVILGLNEKESEAVAEILEIPRKGADSDAVMHSAREIRSMLAISCCVVHPVKYAVCAVSEGVFHQDGPYAPKPLISTGAGDHFNAGFCYGRARGFSIPHCLALGAANSGYYVRTANSPTLNELGRFIDDWHNDKV